MKRTLWDFDMTERRGKFHVTEPRPQRAATTPLWLVLFDLGQIDRYVGRMHLNPQFVFAGEVDDVERAGLQTTLIAETHAACGMCGSLDGTAEGDDGLDRCVGCGCH